MKTEYVIWGITATGTDEQPLFTKAADMGEAENVKKILETKYDCKKCRIQIIDGSIPDFTKTLNI